MPLTHYDKRRVCLCCAVCGQDDGARARRLVPAADAQMDVYHHLFCALAALSAGIAELQAYLHRVSARLRYLDSVKTDSLRNLTALYTAALFQQEQQQAEQQQQGQEQQAGGMAGVREKMKGVLRGCLSYPQTSRLLQETLRATTADVLLGALVVHREALLLKAHMWHRKFSLEQYLEVIHHCRRHAAACVFVRRTAVPATQLFRFDALPPDFLRRPPALQVPLVCVPDIPAPRLTPTRAGPTTLVARAVASSAAAPKQPFFWTQLVFCHDASFQVVLSTASSSTSTTPRDTEAASSETAATAPSSSSSSATFLVPAVAQVTDRGEVRRCAAVRLTGLRPGTAYTLVARTLVDRNQACSEFSRVLAFTTPPDPAPPSH